MVFYHGLPLEWPDGQIFGTICALDSKFNSDAASYVEMLRDFREIVETDLRFLQEKSERENTQLVLTLERTRLAALLQLSTLYKLPETEFIQRGLEEIVRLTNSKIGYLHFIDTDQQTVHLYAWSEEVLKHCARPDSPHYPIDKAGVWADCARLRRPVVHNDYQNLPDIKGYPEGHPHITSHASVPITQEDKVVAIVGVGNKEQPYDESDVTQMTLYLSTMWTLLQRQRAEADLRHMNDALDATVRQRTFELEQACKDLRCSEELYRLTLANLSDAVFVTTDDGTFTFVSPNEDVTFGYSVDEIHAMGNIAKLLGEDLLDRAELARHGQIHNIECTVRDKKGQQRTLLVSVNRVAIDKGMRLYTCRDITDRRRLDDILRFLAGQSWIHDATEFLAQLVAYVAQKLDVDCVVIGTLSGDSRTVRTVAHYVDGVVGRDWCYDLSGTPCENVMAGRLCCHPEGVQERFPNDDILAQLHAQSYLGIPLWDSKGTQVGIFAILDREPMAHTHIVASALQIIGPRVAAELERRASDLALDKSEAEVRLLLDSTAEAIYGLDLHGACVFCNPACARMLGYNDSSELLGKNMHGLMHHTRSDDSPYPIEQCPVNDAFLHGRNVHIQDEFLWRADGSNFPAEYWSYPIRRNGSIVGAVVTFVDITDRLQAEADKAELREQLHHAQKMEAIGQLAGGVAHDFNNLLTVISAHAELAQLRASRDPKITESLTMVREAVRQASGVTMSLLTFSRKLPSEKRAVRLCDIVDRTSRMLRRILSSSIELVVDTACEPDPWISADETQMQQVILNLAVNARDAMPQGGRLHVSLATTSRLATRAGDKHEAVAEHVRLAVSDTGGGMTPEIQSRIFEPFFTTKPRGQGTGLGLSIIHGIVRDHGGEIAVRSHPGEGTTFTIKLPCIPPLGRARDVAEDSHVPRGNGELILLAEDNWHIRAILTDALAELGYTVEQAPDGHVLLELVNLWKTNINLFVFDVDLPKKNGLDCLRSIRERGITTPAIVMTGSVDVDASKALDENSRLLRKPLESSQLARVVYQMLHKRDDPETVQR